MANDKDEESHGNESGTSPENSGGRTHHTNIPIRPISEDVSDKALDRISYYYAIFGFVYIGLGVLAIFVPPLLGTTVSKLLSWILVLSGVVSLVMFYMICGVTGTISFILFGILNVATGVWILLEPSSAPDWATSLTYIIMVWFVLHGLIKFFMCRTLQKLTSWVIVLLSGVVSLGLSIVVLILNEKLEDSTLIIILFGADLCFTGTSLIITAFVAWLGKKKRATTDAEAEGKPLLDGDS